MKKIERKSWSNGNYPKITRVASSYLVHEGSPKPYGEGIVDTIPDNADLLEIEEDKKGVSKLILNGNEFTLPHGVAVVISKYGPVLIFEDGTEIQTRQSSSVYLKGKNGGVDYPVWFSLLKGEKTIGELRTEMRVSELVETLKKIKEITAQGGPGSRKAVREIIDGLLIA